MKSLLKKIGKILLYMFATLVVSLLLLYGYSYWDINNRKNKTFTVAAEHITISRDSAALALGERLARTRACKECHGDDFGGRIIHDDPLIGTLVSKNITTGEGGLPKTFSNEDWVLAMKHGLDTNKKPLYLMPSHELSQLNEEDMAAIIAYCQELPKVDRILPQLTVGPLGYILTEFDLIPLLPAELTNHELPFAKKIVKEVSVEYGQYLSTICINCHGKNLKGGDSPVPGGTPVADITATGNPGKWTHQEFITALHTGKTPEGKQLNPEEMPWTITKNFSEDELTALHLYLKTLQ